MNKEIIRKNLNSIQSAFAICLLGCFYFPLCAAEPIGVAMHVLCAKEKKSTPPKMSSSQNDSSEFLLELGSNHDDNYFLAPKEDVTGYFIRKGLLTTTNSKNNPKQDDVSKNSKISLKSEKNDHKKIKDIIKHVETKYRIPENLLLAIAHVESKGNPWVVWARGKGHIFSHRLDAEKFIQTQKKKGTSTMFVGAMQICMKTHGKKFNSVEDALDPYQNVLYAAKLLRKLYRQYGSWESAVMYYNASDNMRLYRDRVLHVWNKKHKV